MKRAGIFILLFFSLHTTDAQEENFAERIRPDFVQLQFAGSIGLLSVGAGYSIVHDKLHISVMDGFVPASLAGHNINTLAVKSNYDIISLRVAPRLHIKPYTGIALLFETSGNAFYKTLPERFIDRRYYSYSAFHASVFAGLKAQVPIGRNDDGPKLELYAETGTIDAYLYYYLFNHELNFPEVFSGALGVCYHFSR